MKSLIEIGQQRMIEKEKGGQALVAASYSDGTIDIFR